VDTNELLIQLLGHLKKADEARGVQAKSLSDKNIVDNKSDGLEVESSRGKRKLNSVADIFAEKFFQIQKKYTKDTALKTSVQRITPKVISEKNTQFGELGSKKEKGGFFTSTLPRLLGGLFGGGFLKTKLKILITMFKRLITTAVSQFSKLITRIFGKGFTDSLKTMKKTGLAKIGNIFRGGSLMTKMLTFLKPIVPFLRRLPLIGSIISIGIAISRFMKGDIVGGVIDVLSALSVLLYPVAPPVAIGLSIGLDVLNAVLDSKQASPENAGKGKGEILWDMTKSLGKWIWKNSYAIPILGGIKRFSDAHELFKAGDYKNGLLKLGMGIIALGAAPIVTGLEMLLGLFDNNSEDNKDLKPNKNWMSSIKDWIVKNMDGLPWFLRQPLEWFGILDSKNNTNIPNAPKPETNGFVKMINNVQDTIINGATIITNDLTNIFGNVFEKGKSLLQNIGDKVGQVFNPEKIISVVSDINKSISNIFDHILNAIIVVNSYIEKSRNNILKEISNNISSPEQIKLKAFDNNSEFNFGKNTPQIATDNKNVMVNIRTNGDNSGLAEVTDINNDQLKVLQDLRNISVQTLKVLAKNNEQSTSIPSMTPTGYKSSDNIKNGGKQHSMRVNRGDYGSSPYALA